MLIEKQQYRSILPSAGRSRFMRYIVLEESSMYIVLFHIVSNYSRLTRGIIPFAIHVCVKFDVGGFEHINKVFLVSSKNIQFEEGLEMQVTFHCGLISQQVEASID